MALVIIFLLGIGNFALHKAVLESGHALLGQMPWFVHMLGGRITLATEFLVLLAALALAGCGFRLQGVDQFPESLATTYIDTENVAPVPNVSNSFVGRIAYCC